MPKPPPSLTLAPPTAADEADWRLLWDGYCRFYKVDLSAEVTAGTWARLLDPACPIHGLIARDGDRALGFVNYVIHANTWSLAPVCYLEDLFTAPEARGRGVGRALIGRLGDLARAEGWRHVYWHTHDENATARALYDSLTGGRDSLVRYVLRP
ncbi:MAG: hypothetical protein RLY86_3213 [Pseudomonadota bacterium]|jgi:GNAT superfamily N-acetyltransferase